MLCIKDCSVQVKFQTVTHPFITDLQGCLKANEILMNRCFVKLFQGELIVGDQSGAIHMWDLKTDHNEQLV